METQQVVEALSELPEIRVTVQAGRVGVVVPAIDDTVWIDAGAVWRHRNITAPNGDPAVEFVLDGEQGMRPLILTPGDVVFAPVDTGVVLDSAIAVRVADAPSLVAYSEMERTAEQVARACAQGGPIELDGLAAGLLLVRCQIVAAVRAGLWPVRSAAWWQRGWTALGGDLPLPPFRPDPMWDGLMRETMV